MPIRHIFLDMDGVIADFVIPSLTVHGRMDLLDSWPAGVRSMSQVLNISNTQFWKALNVHGADFWANFPPYEWTQELFAMLQEVAPVTILTSPSKNPECPTGKVRWLHQHFGSSFRDFLIGPQKYLLAHPDRVLVDDDENNIDKFEEAGGHGILFPQIWNRNHKHTDPMDYVRQRIAEIQGVLS